MSKAPPGGGSNTSHPRLDNRNQVPPRRIPNKRKVHTPRDDRASPQLFLSATRQREALVPGNRSVSTGNKRTEVPTTELERLLSKPGTITEDRQRDRPNEAPKPTEQTPSVITSTCSNLTEIKRTSGTEDGITRGQHLRPYWTVWRLYYGHSWRPAIRGSTGYTAPSREYSTVLWHVWDGDT